MKKLISFDIYADMGFLKKPDINEKIYLTYNMLHKPCVLGILGAIAGLKGFTENNKLPEYYDIFKTIPVGIHPIEKYCENGVFKKTVIKYNNATCFANKGIEGHPNVQAILNVSEQTLINPAYRIFLLLDDEKEYEQLLYERIHNQQAEYIPYLGKNDYSAWWYAKDVKEYKILDFDEEQDFKVNTVFVKQNALIDNIVEDDSDDDFGEFEISDFGSYVYFEKLPYAYCNILYQYKYADFALTDSKLKAGSLPKETLYRLKYKAEAEIVVQLN
jgi:CRISPR-associated protein Cas5h